MRFLKPIKDRTDEKLESLSGVYERWALGGAIAVIVGIAIEVYIVIENPPYGACLQRYGSLAADLLVGFGIIAEVWFGKLESLCQSELRRRSNESLAHATKQAGDAHERAGTAEAKAADLEVEALKLQTQLAPREITKGQYEILLTLQDKVDMIGVTAFPDNESVGYARQIVETLRRAKIRSTLYEPRINLPWSGIYVVVPHNLMNYASEPIYAAFVKAGIKAGCGPRDRVPMTDLPRDIPIIMVGEKHGLKQPAPPFVFTLPRDPESEQRTIIG